MGSSPRLIDLSIARTTTEAAALDHVVGTDDYLSPEQCDPPATGSPGAPADVWGLGATLYRACTGFLPFDIKAAQNRDGGDRWPQLTEKPAAMPRDLPDTVTKPILAALERQPEDRPTAVELAGALEPLVASLPKPVLGGFRRR